MPKSEKDIGDEFRRLVHGARERKSRIKMVASEGSGYGSKVRVRVRVRVRP